MKKKPWSGRFRAPMAETAELFSSSINYDVRLYKHDIVQNIAYAGALLKAKVLTAQECAKIIKALEEILKGIEKGTLKLKPELEDIHMNIEAALIDKVGDIGKKLHSGRSRNDQVATDARLLVKYETTEIIFLIKKLQTVILNLADEHLKVIMPGYTHLQRAQPVLFSHHLMAYFEMLQRDKERLLSCQNEADVMPLGSGALAGNSFGLNLDLLAKELGFSKISKNSIDAVSDRDFAIDFVFACSMLMMHLSRFSEELVIWSSFEFNFIELSDKYTTGSSIMPQKKNPDLAELSRGKTGRVYGSLIGLLTMMKGLPLAYNRDLQEDKEALFNAMDTVKGVLSVYPEMLESMKVNAEIMAAAVKKGFLTATDLAYYLVRRGVPFREAHEIVGKIVAYCEESNMQLEYMSLKQLKGFSEHFEYDSTRVLSAESSIASRDLQGGTSPKRVREAIKNGRKNLLHDKA
ncbi:argininosuccinate lyase [candidate division WOR-1 bacterium RIFOXYA12_FULL_52_29]|uniref:Argininosuccinate lyase n=1 Tax=candidate division WOR-1 bacterium RIFOXYC12_FULL_54_18 TaxID=1802584 RepID=A0A1F4T7E5_UNCSA|nr:MAG: argininosuccinate lyase [candidate division WOR-1 bacterium RIFOXYA2_FULL_51_19]OGC18211.1 MAG: argininosuccinate lyase [candidate division WOR-1 bacterium RIFOXYA12_FULL_52_29]OGC27066.1 MAG: argininosuccinate lyase [candidate division WOR-1 bacterium RIFOXYB2_FULL_45_9]OGC28628.1 MAG: argininosuccinate lyase [candidate division WOR-1 bacterium RIFOXYC12_FULL_54_18]OGC30917.1 MAG: argininosuccinate lyase [candidate division WOR-1 bacterium RIFOXYB12_FULL_52_16]